MAINWAPATRSDEIQQCVGALLSTTPGTVPFSRALGIDGLVDTPTPAAIQLLKVSAVRAVRTYEPRAIVRRVTVEESEAGTLRPTVTIEEVLE